MPRSIPFLMAILLLPFVLHGASGPARANAGETEDEALILDADGFKSLDLAVYGEDFVIVVATILFPSHGNPPRETPLDGQPSTPESIIRWNLVSWTSAVDPRCAPL